MQDQTNKTLGGYAWWQCITRTQNDFDPDLGPEDEDPTDAFTEALFEAGNNWETEIGEQLFAAFGGGVHIDTTFPLGKTRRARALDEARGAKLVAFIGDRSEESLTLREDLTHALLENPGQVRLLWNPRLRKWRKDGRGKLVYGDRSAEPDVLYRQNVRVAKSPKWGSIDVKFYNPFEGTAQGLTWAMSSLTTPFPEKSTEVPWVGTLKAHGAGQLAHYYRMLEFHGAAGSPVAGLIGKPLDDEVRVVWIDMNDNLYERATTSILALYDQEFAKRIAVLHREIERVNDPSLKHLSHPEWKAECKTCPWHTYCHGVLATENHISLVAGVTPSKLPVHYAAGVTTATDLARLDVTTAQLVEAGVGHLEELVEAAKASHQVTDTVEDLIAEMDLPGRETNAAMRKLAERGITVAAQVAQLDPATARYPAGTKGLIKSIDQARVVDCALRGRVNLVFRARGVTDLVIPRPTVEIHVDMENDEYIYLWGMYSIWRRKGSKMRRDYRNYKPYVSWSGTAEGEAHAFITFWNDLQDLIARAREEAGEDGVCVFHYTAAEDRCMRHIAGEYIGMEGMPTITEVDEFLSAPAWVDLYPLMTNQLVWPAEDGTLKTLGRLIGFQWRDEDPGGDKSILMYRAALDLSSADYEMWRQRLLRYNEDDCMATAAMLEWLQKAGAVDSASKLASVEDPALEARYRRRRR